MTKVGDSHEPHEHTGHSPHRVRLPGFITDEEIGLGDVIERATSYVGIKPCGSCKRRAAALNRWVAFTGWK
jgi:hypothetical protein